MYITFFCSHTLTSGDYRAEALCLFEFAHRNGFLRIIISNQQGVGKGLMSESDLDAITDHFQWELQSRTGTFFDDVYYCTDLSSSNSAHRKPKPGMLLDAIAKWNIDVVNSWMIGDSINDVIAGRRAGVNTILVGDFSNVPDADFIVPSLQKCLEKLKEIIGNAS